ncbi:MAG: universal stress protein [Candidatus Methanomethylophilaceae archaeon]|nr:universal stress protein [Candidatus Methanomethylophilaceae archaeon]
MTEQMKFDKVLVPIDGSASSKAAIDLALHSALEFSATLVFVYVVDMTSLNKFGSVDPAQDYYKAKIEGNIILESAAKQAEKVGAKHEEVLAEGAPWEILNEMSKDADMMIMSVTGKSGMRAGRIGSTAKKVIEGSYCPVLTLKSASSRLEKILLPVYEENRPAIDDAIQTAKRSGSSITVLSVKMKNSDPQPLVNKIAAEIQAEGIECEGTVVEGDPVETILSLSGKYDLIIVGVDKRSNLDSILHGGKTERIVTMASCPVTVIRNV